MMTKQISAVVFGAFILLGAGCQNSTVPASQPSVTPNQPVVESLVVPSETPTEATVNITAPISVSAPAAEVKVVPTAPAVSAPVAPKVEVVPVANKAVTINNFAFTPSNVEIKKGATITWTNNDSAPHTVTSNGGPFSSATLSNGQSFSFTFNQVGTFTYHCAIHPSMTGGVVVTE